MEYRLYFPIFLFSLGMLLHTPAHAQSLDSAGNENIFLGQDAEMLAVHLASNPNIPTCPVASCPTSTASGAPVLAALVAY